MKILKARLKSSPFYRLYLIPSRLTTALSYYTQPLKSIFLWVVTSREVTNFTYDLHEQNLKYLASFVANVTGISTKQAHAYVSEIHEDQELRKHVSKYTKISPVSGASDSSAKLGRRIGWYAIVRALKPRVVVETGVDKGLGSCVLAAALLKNRAEGFEGHYYGTDLNPSAGFLFKMPYRQCGEILYGDSIESLKKLTPRIDLFINDSDHSADYETQEYEVIRQKLSSRAVILADNAHCTDRLYEFALKYNLKFNYFQEKPKAHWYPGGGIGAAYPSVLEAPSSR